MLDKSCIDYLVNAGIDRDDAETLRRISMVLHRWHERECGDSDESGSFCIVRGFKDKNGKFEYLDDGKPYEEYHSHRTNDVRYSPIADKETSALKHLGKIMAKYPSLSAYVQGDPRGASLYILRPGDVPEGQDAGSYYNRGIAVYK